LLRAVKVLRSSAPRSSLGACFVSQCFALGDRLAAQRHRPLFQSEVQRSIRLVHVPPTEAGADRSGDEQSHDGDRCGHRLAPSSVHLAQAVADAGWRGKDRLIVEESTHVLGEAAGGLVATRAVLRYRFHDDPVEVATQPVLQLLDVGVPLPRERPGPHAQLDDLQRDLASDRLRLLGHPHGAHPAFPDLLQELVAIDQITGDLTGGGGLGG
jgi:hypothetical protein